MVRLLERQFEVSASVGDTWRVLARVWEWPRWARHIRRVDLTPAGVLGSDSSGAIRLRNGIRATFRMREFRPGTSWKWVGPFLWLAVFYDHQFEPVGPNRCRLTWTVDADGFAESTLGRIFAAMYARNLDRAIPAFVAYIERMDAGGEHESNV